MRLFLSLELFTSSESSDFRNHPSRLSLETAINVSCLHYEGVQSGSCVSGCVSSGAASPLLPLRPFIFCLPSLTWFLGSGFCYIGSARDLVYLPEAAGPAVHPAVTRSVDCLGGERADCSLVRGCFSVVSQGHTRTNCQCSDGRYP